jgi:hypothetical protein
MLIGYFYSKPRIHLLEQLTLKISKINCSINIKLTKKINYIIMKNELNKKNSEFEIKNSKFLIILDDISLLPH